MKALVTGAGGFIGRHLVERLLRDGHTVRALVREAGRSGDWPATVDVVTGDVRDPQAMKAAAAGCEEVFHLAGKAHALTEVQGDEAAYRDVNAEGTRHVLEGAVAGGARRFVLFSSVKAMGEGDDRCLDETFDGPPETPYGRSKLEAERLVGEIGRRAGLHAACLRFPLVYGPGNKGNLYKMIAAVDRGLFPPLPELGNRRSMVHVVDVVRAALLAAGQAAANGRCYIVTDGRGYSTRELYELICRALGRRIPGWQVPLWALRAMGRAGDAIGRIRGERFVFDSDALDKLAGSAWYSSEKIARELGYRPTVTFPEALPELVAWYRKGRA
ncbi:MAG: NAD-dependent epimerase/dehydratase family protein [Nitrospirae bacterium]|nr:MAG: NAD-dependent epimerase/dehydratase family protein [Nitrospirota bacterium]